MKIALIYNLNRGNYEQEVEFDLPITINALKKVIAQNHQLKCIEANKEITAWISKLIAYQPDLIFNIAEGYNGNCRESFYASLFDQLNFKFTGPSAINLAIFQNKYITKKLANLLKIKTPQSIIYNSNEDLKYISKLKFPVIVKFNAEGSSMGITGKSIIKDKNKLVKYLMSNSINVKKNLIIEEYIDGYDVSMAYVEGLGMLGSAKIIYSPKNIYDWDLKTIDDKKVEIKKGLEISKINIARLIKITDKLINFFDVKGYAKIDFRINKGGVNLIEINGQVSFHPNGEFIVAAETSGYNFKKIINHIINYAAKSLQTSKGLNNL